VVSERYYLADASFLVVIQAEPHLVERIMMAVQNPFWPVYLGRRSCPPSRPIFEGGGDYRTLEDALQALPIPFGAVAGDKTIQVRAVLECLPNEDGAVRRRDEINSRSRRTYFPRYSRDTLLSVAVEEREV
jgi:CRISPR system Cascade subunit CasD